VANEYATTSELKSALTLLGENFADDEIALALTAASRGIDHCTDRRFWADADATQVRYYTPRTCRLVEIDDLVTLTAVAIDLVGDATFATTWTVNSDFVLEPLNAAADARPYTQIRLTPYRAQWLPAGRPRSVRVTGKFGWAAIPPEVKEATIVLAAKLMRRAREAPFGIVTAGLDEGAAMRIARTDPDVAFLVGPLKRNQVKVA
jgi:hypothetical protein